MKAAAAHSALQLVKPGMRLGLGTGSTARHFIDALAGRVRDGLEGVVCVPTSEVTRRQAQARGLVLAGLDEIDGLDLTVDGADELDARLDLIKGGGGALLREKIVAAASARLVIIADESKRVETLGSFALPIEVVPFGGKAVRRAIERVLASCGHAAPLALRRDGAGVPFVTDGGGHIIDCALGRIDDPARLAAALSAVPGVVEHGLFIGLCTEAHVASPGRVAILRRNA